VCDVDEVGENVRRRLGATPWCLVEGLESAEIVER